MITSKMLLGAMSVLAVTVFAKDVLGGWLLGVLLGTMLVLAVTAFAE